MGWDARVEGDAIRLLLRWQGERTPLDSIWFSALLIAPDGTVVDPGVWQPGQTTPIPPNSSGERAALYPTTCWTTGTTVDDSVTLRLPELGDTAGEWWISLSAFSAARLDVLFGDGTEDSQVELGPIVVGTG
jgi:hypothetical protein